ncbi:hypothetical protein [Aneurinibacillus migulanus]|uniref:hypothetical protein n=1 Tax=Aneurinibacillus migulanus TaxID=47500 RepID=UPI001F3E90DA|nr:hypothetical protein [Aneurinibacillus migulanus]
MIHRQILVVRGKKRRRGGSGRKKTRWPFLYWSAGRIQPLLFLNHLLPTTLPYQNIKCNLYRQDREGTFYIVTIFPYLSNTQTS